AGDEVVAVTTTGDDGKYELPVAPNATYFVAVASRSVTPSAGYNDGFDSVDVWAEQTYGPIGALCANPDGLFEGGDPYERGDAGPCFGGVNGAVSDGLPTDLAVGSELPSGVSVEHVAKVEVNTEDVTGLDFGFSFNVVTNVNDRDDDTSADRTAQGSLRQFLQNANAIRGDNTMRFVPAVSPNVDKGEGAKWWKVTISDFNGDGVVNEDDTLPAIEDSSGATVIDGTAYSYSDGTSLDTNREYLPKGCETVGVDKVSFRDLPKPELEVAGRRGSTPGGLDWIFKIETKGSAKIANVSVHGAGKSTADGYDINPGLYDDIRVMGAEGGFELYRSVIGLPPNGEFTDIPESEWSLSVGIYISSDTGDPYVKDWKIHENLVGYTGAHGVFVNKNENFVKPGDIYQNEITHTNKLYWNDADALTLERGAKEHNIYENCVINNNGSGFDSWGRAYNITWENNTIRNNGWNIDGNENLGEERFGARLWGKSQLFTKNIVAGNYGPGVIVTGGGQDPKDGITLSMNRFSGNGPENDNTRGLAIDLGDEYFADITHHGVTPNDGVLNNDLPNVGLDYPIFEEAILAGNHLVLKGYIGTKASKLVPPEGKTWRIEIYLADDDGNNNGEVELGDGKSEPHGEGKEWLYTIKITSEDFDEDGNFNLVVPRGDLSAGVELTAIVIDTGDNKDYGHTSEFGPNIKVDELKSFRCEPAFYQVIEEELKKLNTVTGKYDLINASKEQYNAIGWDQRTNLIYGIGPYPNDGGNPSTTWFAHLLVVGDTYEGYARDLGMPIEVGTGKTLEEVLIERKEETGIRRAMFLIAGDMDYEGNLYARMGLKIFKKNNKWYGTELIKINVDTKQFEVVEFDFECGSYCSGQKHLIADIVYIKDTHSFWGASNNLLYQWDLQERKIRVKEVQGLPQGDYGAAYTDKAGNLFVSKNKSSSIYRIDGYTGSSPVAVEIFNRAEPTDRNDGASCPNAYAPGFGMPVSGQLYHDLEPNFTRDGSDPAINEASFNSDDPPTLYVKLVKDDDGDCTNGYAEDEALQVVEVQDDGSYYIPGAPVGTSCLILSADDDPTKLTSFDPTSYGWLYTNPPDGVLPLEITREQSSGGQTYTGNDFGFFHGSKV
ncbi:MAG: right-handed parallel beta-helix repeat-containing protein, partial [Thermotogae bacterium]|nr:right-handed parallel beta-helix repeat-containing protein [Thermotogota bacterium]